ncbi:DUF6264 family protein [Leifsonia poae]|uniref:Uncharacterized protein n=1 Tax=Leifsonia poae TaxID=110933 RepID=A0A9W6LYE3_9MICO|nr:DUF6264 family protein [Leifsonia poae]GLJ74492.1 hypothetical protein GCM10017584_00650 [Leifsonia poae]
MADEEQRPDERPRPQFGELAPEGWVWRPPADADRLDTARKPEPVVAEHPEPVQRLPRPGDYPPPTDPALRPPQLRRDAPRWNLGWTLSLLIVGFLGMSYSIGVINAFPSAIQLVHSTENLGDYTPDPAVPGILITGSIVMVVLWAGSAALSIWLLTQRRLAFYVPLIAGALALVAMIVFLSVALATDPALLSFYSGVTPSSTPTP